MLLFGFLIYIYLGIKNSSDGKRLSKTIIIWTGYLFISSELLSCVHLFCDTALLILWYGADALMFTYLTFYKKYSWKKAVTSARAVLPKCKCWKWHQWFVIAMVCLAGILALLIRPYTGDSMAYHLTRVVFWTQNRSISHYATSDIRQIASPVLAELICANVYMLMGKMDWLLNMVQWMFLILDLFLMKKLSQKLIGESNASSLIAFFFISAPIVFGEATSTQVDLIATCYLLIFLDYLLDIMRSIPVAFNKNALYHSIQIGLCVGFGYLAKPTVGIVMLVFSVWCLGYVKRRKGKTVNLIKMALIAIPFFVIAILPEAIRNIVTFGQIIPAANGLMVKTAKVNYLIINFLKNFSINFSNWFIPYWNEVIQKVVEILADILNVNINDGTISLGALPYEMVPPTTLGFDDGVNFALVLFSLLCTLFGIVICVKKKKCTLADQFCMVSFISFVAICTIAIWEIQVERYMIPAFSVMAVSIGVMTHELMEIEKIRKLVSNMIVLMVCVSFDVWVVTVALHTYHLKKSFEVGYYQGTEYLIEPYKEALSVINSRGIKSVGLDSVVISYPLLSLLQTECQNELQVGYVNVENESAKYMNREFYPECIIVEMDKSDIEYYYYEEMVYECVFEDGNIAIFICNR